MSRGKRYQPEQVVNLLGQIEVAVANGKTTAQACKEAEMVEQTYFRWRKEYGGLQIDQRDKKASCKNKPLIVFFDEASSAVGKTRGVFRDSATCCDLRFW